MTIPRHASRKDRNFIIHKYILGCIDGDGYKGWKGNETDAEKIKFLLDTFHKEYGHEIKRRGEQNAFKEWCQGLPTCFGIAFNNYEIIQLGKSWGLLKTDATESQEDKFIENYWNRLYMNVNALAKKLKVR